ncbi:transposase [Brucella pecoris]|nr:transposase [Brucella pecoris]
MDYFNGARSNGLIIGRMDTDTTYDDLNVLEVVDTGRRRRFSATAKRQIVEESYSSEDSVTTVARRHSIFPAQLF